MSQGLRRFERDSIGEIGSVASTPPMTWVRASAPMTMGALTASPREARMRSSRISPAVRYRFSGFFERAFMTTASTDAGTAGFSSEGGRASSRTCW
ncbi:hypothetical protein GCM10028833_13760 [Glycomyces tarimensis]